MSEMGGTPTYGHLSKDNDDEPNAMKNPVYQPFHRTQFHKPSLLGWFMALGLPHSWSD